MPTPRHSGDGRKSNERKQGESSSAGQSERMVCFKRRVGYKEQGAEVFKEQKGQTGRRGDPETCRLEGQRKEVPFPEPGAKATVGNATAEGKAVRSRCSHREMRPCPGRCPTQGRADTPGRSLPLAPCLLLVPPIGQARPGARGQVAEAPSLSATPARAGGAWIRQQQSGDQHSALGPSASTGFSATGRDSPSLCAPHARPAPGQAVRLFKRTTSPGGGLAGLCISVPGQGALQGKPGPASLGVDAVQAEGLTSAWR